MVLRNFVGRVFGFNDELALYHTKEQNYIKLIGDFEVKVKYWHSLSEKYGTQVEELERKAEDFKKPVQVPSAEITFKRPVLVGKNEFKQVEIDIRNFIMPDFKMENALKKRKLMYDGTQDLDVLIPEIYHLAKTSYKYGRDKEYGFNEYWMFPFELKTVLKYKKAGDCEDWSNLIGSYFAAAGIPRNRWLVSVGKARAGYNHATVYVKNNSGSWNHLNSTKPNYKAKDLSGYPRNDDKTDKPGITENGFWFSYNDFFAIHRWDSEIAKQAFEASGLSVTIRKGLL